MINKFHAQQVVLHSLHDVGAAVWLGGSLMGAVALNGTVSDVSNPRERAALAAGGWARWSPVNAAAVGAHVLGGVGLALTDRRQQDGRGGLDAVTKVKAVVTGVAMLTTAYSGFLGARIATAGYVPSDAATTPGTETPDKVAAAQDRLRRLQWVTPALTGLVVVLAGVQGEPQQPPRTLSGRVRQTAGRAKVAISR